jgi:hypothetical protein
MNAQGVIADRGEVRKLFVPPGETGEFAIALKKDMPAGSYTLVMTSDLEEGDVLVKEIDFKKTAAGTLSITADRD